MRKRKSVLFFAVNLTFALLLLHGPSVSVAQQAEPSGQKTSLPFPVIPVIIEYDYVPLYFMQWTDGDPHYSRIAAAVYPGEVNDYQIMLTEKSGGNVYYSNSKQRIEALTREGKQAHLVSIDYKRTQSVGQPSTYGFGFRDTHGRAILWRFIPASRPSERGSGLTPQPQTPGLRLMYRNLGTAAGAGTAVQIGDRVSEAEAWPEISSPPYFVAYRGSHSEGMDNGALLPGSETWRVVSAPSVADMGQLREGAQWTFREVGGRERTLRINARIGDEVTITEANAEKRDGPKLEIVARLLPQGFALRQVRLTERARSMRVTFTPELNLSNASAGASIAVGDINFEITLGNNRKVVQGTVSIERQDNGLRLRWTSKSPEWAKARAFTSTIKMDAGGYMIETQ